MQCYTEPERKGAEKGNYCKNLKADQLTEFLWNHYFLGN